MKRVKLGSVTKKLVHSRIVKGSHPEAPTTSTTTPATIAGRFGFWAKRYWLGFLVILIATLAFFWPIVTRIDSYSEGGDAMFNAWTLARNHHCILGECENYVNANIYFPHQDTMLYSETQLSAGLLTLPLFFINDNPIFAYNIWTITSIFLGGFFMYMLAMYISRGRQWISILVGLAFALAPFKMSAIFHLQNLSIFYLPLAVLLAFKFFDTKNKWYLGWLALVLSLQFYASWYNMVFVAAALGLLIVGMRWGRLISWRQFAAVVGALAIAAISILPLAKEYMRFSNEKEGDFSGIYDQTLYASSVADYLLPHSGTVMGKVFHEIIPVVTVNSFNLDSVSYHGLVLYGAALALLAWTFWWRKKNPQAWQRFGLAWSFGLVGLVGFIFSLGPLLKIKGNLTYATMQNGTEIALAAPYLLIDWLLPQLSFIRAVGRWSVLTLFALCYMAAYLAYLASKHTFYQKHALKIAILVSVVAFVELMPIHQVHMSSNSYSYNLAPPKVYEYVKAHPEINNIIVLRGDEDYPKAPIPIARAEDVLWAGYHNRNIFNGYSGYTPPNYFIEYGVFKDYEAGAADKMRALGLKYIIVDKQLSTQRPQLAERVASELPKLYEDERYSLHKLEK